MVVPVRIGVAYLTRMERKVLGAVQRRQGPNVVGIWGRFTPLADGRKLLLKERIFPTAANRGVFFIAPIRTFSRALRSWAVMPIGKGQVYADVSLGVLYLFAVSSRAVYGIMRAGWSSNSKYAFLGALRSAAQMVSYEVSIGFIRVTVMLCAGSANLTKIVEAQEGVWYMFPLAPMFLMFFISALAETNRHPFDLPEAEAERVAGYNVEYSGMGFVLFFLGEYSNMIVMSALTSVLFRGGWLSPFGVGILPGSIWMGLKTVFVLMGFVRARVAYPRYRYDQLMRLGWKVFLPVSRGYVGRTAGRLRGVNGLPR